MKYDVKESEALVKLVIGGSSIIAKQNPIMFNRCGSQRVFSFHRDVYVPPRTCNLFWQHDIMILSTWQNEFRQEAKERCGLGAK